ncbi:hypothetical protein SAMD00019534_050530, partial [Acytostelium subglobosum LB1]|uniref:hypothetical protein n=1 Tax=Acytostelium subglobosum LB1 TaxID=1410327 RepID=UPI000644A454
SPRNQYVSKVFQQCNFATLLFDLMTAPEEELDNHTGELRFNLNFLAKRIIGATNWIQSNPVLKDLQIGFFGASTGGGGALLSTCLLAPTTKVFAVVSRGGRPDMVGEHLKDIATPTLLVVGGNDTDVLRMNRVALQQMVKCPTKQLVVIPNASHLFPEPGCLEQVATISKQFFLDQIKTMGGDTHSTTSGVAKGVVGIAM